MKNSTYIEPSPAEMEEIDRAASTSVAQIKNHFQPILDRLESFQIELNQDPIKMGLGQFNEKLAVLRANANVVSTHLARAIAMKADYTIKVNKIEAALREKTNNVITLDPEVVAISGMEAKKIAASMQLKREERILFNAKQILQLVKGYSDALSVASKNMSDTKSDLMKQLAVVKQMIVLGESSIPPVQGSTHHSRMDSLENELTKELGNHAGRVSL